MSGGGESPASTTNKPDKQMIRFQKLILPILAGLLSACGQPQCVITPRPEHFERKCGYFPCDSARVAEGEIPTSHGILRVCCRREGKTVKTEVSAPAGVRGTVKE